MEDCCGMGLFIAAYRGQCNGLLILPNRWMQIRRFIPTKVTRNCCWSIYLWGGVWWCLSGPESDCYWNLFEIAISLAWQATSLLTRALMLLMNGMLVTHNIDIIWMVWSDMHTEMVTVRYTGHYVTVSVPWTWINMHVSLNKHCLASHV